MVLQFSANFGSKKSVQRYWCWLQNPRLKIRLMGWTVVQTITWRNHLLARNFWQEFGHSVTGRSLFSFDIGTNSTPLELCSKKDKSTGFLLIILHPLPQASTTTCKPIMTVIRRIWTTRHRQTERHKPLKKNLPQVWLTLIVSLFWRSREVERWLWNTCRWLYWIFVWCGGNLCCKQTFWAL